MCRDLGCDDDLRWDAYARKRDAVAAEHARLSRVYAAPNNALGAEIAQTLGITITREASAMELLRRPELDYAKLMQVASLGPGVPYAAVAEQVEVGIKYAGYLDRQRDEIERQRRHEALPIPEGFVYADVRGLSAEVAQKLARVKPETIGQAARFSGVTPAHEFREVQPADQPGVERPLLRRKTFCEGQSDVNEQHGAEDRGDAECHVAA